MSTNEESLSSPADGVTNTETPLSQDPAFSGLVSTQFLGAFNDNYFKQMVLLKCTELAAVSAIDLQLVAQGAFALPFVLLSGFGGYISDRMSKRSVIVWCKVAEIAVMAASLWVLMLPNTTAESQLRLLIVVLAFMGAQSAIFGPSKYGILPELFQSNQLRPVNGAIQMTTFLAIIFGMTGAGIALDKLDNSLWLCSLVAIGIAILGTITSLLVRRTAVAKPDLSLQRGNLFIPRDIRNLFHERPKILKAILVMMMFWFIGGVAQPAVNNLGEHVLHFSKTRTSMLAASIAVGIAIGCVVSGFANRDAANAGARWTTRGGWMIVFSLMFIAILSSGIFGLPAASADQSQGIFQSLLVADSLEWLLRFSMLALGVSAGIFVVPVQVYIQEAPPADQKGRMIGAMNFITWIGILLSVPFLALMNVVMAWFAPEDTWREHQYAVFLTLALVMAPVAKFYRLPVATTDMTDSV